MLQPVKAACVKLTCSDNFDTEKGKALSIGLLPITILETTVELVVGKKACRKQRK